MKFYEIPLIVGDDVPAQGVAIVTSKIRDILEKASGKILRVEYWGLRELAYKIGKNKKGRYYCLFISADNTFVNLLTTYLNTNEVVIRYSIFAKDTAQDCMVESLMAKKFRESNPELNTEDKEFSVIFESKETA